MSCGRAGDFFVSINFDGSTLFDFLLPLFEMERPLVNYGSPFRKVPKCSGMNAFVESVDIICMALWYLKSSYRQHKLGSIFGIVPSCISV